MPLVSIGDQLKRAQQEHYAIPLFDTLDTHSTDGMFQAFEEKRAPGIVALYPAVFNRPNTRALSAYIRTRAEESSLPISLMLDHGDSFELCMKAISWGYTDVMFDGSRLPLEENIEITSAVVRAAHAMGVAVEAELGHVGSGHEYRDYGGRGEGFTDPDAVEAFVARTGVDFLAVAIGTAHGHYEGEPQLDLELLGELRARVETPLVLHGGSGLTESLFRGAIAAGIAKINVATDLYATTGQRLVEAATGEGASYGAISQVALDSFEERCNYYLDLFGATGKGSPER